MGKSRLVTEFVSGLDDARVLVGGCLELGQAVMPFAPLAGVLRDLSKSLGPDETNRLYGRELARFLPDQTVRSEVESTWGQSGLFEAVLALLGRLADESAVASPVVLVLEDLHWADRSTLDLVTFLARNLSESRILLLGTYRSDEMRKSHALRPVLAELSRLPLVERIHLEPLNEAEVVELVTAITGATPSQFEVGAIVERSEGNPFFAEELLAAGGLGEPGVPTTLRDILGARLDALPEQAKEVLRIAAAAGRRVDHRLLERVAQLPDDELYGGLRTAVEHQALVADGDGYRFRHALLQEAVHEQLLPGERARLHGSFAKALTEDPGLAADGADGVHAELAHHAFAAHDLELAFTSLVKAGHRAWQLFAYPEAQQHFERAAELRERVSSPESPPYWELLRRAAHSARYAGDIRAAVAHLRRALAAAEADCEPLTLGGLHGELSESLWLHGQSDEAVAASDRSLEVLPDEPSRERADALGWRSRLLMLLGRYDEAIPPGREGVEVARVVEAPLELCRALNSLGTSLTMADDPDAGLPLLREAIEVGLAIDAGPETLRAYINLTSCLNTPLNDVEQAEPTALTGLQYCAEKGLHGVVVDWLRLELTDSLFRQGRWQEADHRAGTVRSGSVAGVNGQYFNHLMANIRVQQGRHVEAERHVRRAEELAPAIRDPQAVGPIVDTRLRILMATGELDRVAEVADPVTRSLRDPLLFRVHTTIARAYAEAALTAGDPHAEKLAEVLLDRLVEQRTSLRPDGPVGTSLDDTIIGVQAELARIRGTATPEPLADCGRRDATAAARGTLAQCPVPARRGSGGERPGRRGRRRARTGVRAGAVDRGGPDRRRHGGAGKAGTSQAPGPGPHPAGLRSRAHRPRAGGAGARRKRANQP